jgi:tetratricopeptide (TPR) repeat protein
LRAAFHLDKRFLSIAFWLCLAALIYAAFAGLKTVVDFDLGWQMATARYIWEHHSLSSTDVFSYTAHGATWIYPILPGALFLLAYKIGGYVAISWLCAIGCVATVALLSVRQTAWTAALAVLSVPVLAEQTMPRSGMFTVVLFAAFARVLLDYFARGHAPLWLLPLIMIGWVNLHLGFISGLSLIVAYLLLEALELPFVDRRQAALIRLTRAWPWLFASVAATILNPWGWRIWRAVAEQEFPSRTEQTFILEFRPINAMTAISEWRNPDNAVYWIILVAVLAMLVALWRKHIGSALLLLLAIAAVPEHARISAPFVSLVCLLGGSELAGAWETRKIRHRFSQQWQTRSSVAGVIGVSLVLALVAIRCVDLVTNRFYIVDGQVALFGAGPAWWLPQRATDFLRNKHLPREVFSTFNLSSYLVWKVGDSYLDFDDGRYIPFGDALFYEQRTLTRQPLDSPMWDEVAHRRNIRTVIFPLSPLLALGDIPLKQDCSSVRWSAVYMDTTAVIFIRRDAIPDSVKGLSDFGCTTHTLLDERPQKRSTFRSRAETYQQLLNAAAIEYLLGHAPEAQTMLAKAEQITDVDPALYLQKAELATAARNYEEAEGNFRKSLARMPSDSAWYGLGVLYMNEQRYDEALAAFRNSAKLAGLERYQRLYILGKAYAVAKQPEEALRMLDEAQAQSPFRDNESDEAAEFLAEIAEAKAAAYSESGDAMKTVAEQKNAVEKTPKNPLRWRLLAEAYRAAGMSTEAEIAQRRAELLQASSASKTGSPERLQR